MIQHPPEQIIYSLPPNHDIEFPEDLKNDPEIIFHRGIPDVQDFKDGRRRLLIIDDQIQECLDDAVALFTRGSHHYNISVIVLTQNIFFANPGFRTMSLNAHYIVVFKNPRALDQVSYMGRQICPNNAKFFLESYIDSTREPHSYFLMDMTQSCDDQLRFRSKIFPDDENCTTIYVPLPNKKKSLK